MRKKAEHDFHKSRRVKPWFFVAVLLVNVVIFAFIGTVYISSDRSYNEKLFNENINNVENLNTASANAAYTYTTGMGVKIDDTLNYIKAKDLGYDEVIDYLGESNTNPERQFQIVLCGSYGDTGVLSYGDYSGVSVRKVINDAGGLDTVETAIQYDSSYYDIYKLFTDVEDMSFHGICFAPEFTDPDTKLKCFAVYRHVVLEDNEGKQILYALLLAVNSQKALDAYDVQSKYDGQSSVLVNADGDYIIKNSDFRNVNFYDYIVNYNGLTLDWRDRLPRDISEGTADGEPVNLFYKNHQGEDCVFSVTAIENGWYGITCVPLSSFELQNETVNYSLVILLLFVALFIVDGLAIFIVGRVMSYNIAVAEQATKEANEANQAKSRFLSTMSHELRTPLNAIIGLVALSEDSLGKQVVLRDYLKKIDISSKLLLQLISDILDVSAIESNKMKLSSAEFDMAKLISSLSAIYYDQCAVKGVEFNVVLKNMHTDSLIGDSVRVNQILLNFLSNAVKFTPNGGKVTLCAEQVARDGDTVIIRFSVSDTGCGISDELSTRLFRPFERATGEVARRHSGTGLGLAIAKNLAELMKGSVGVESTEGEGSVFWAELPFEIPTGPARKSFSPIQDLRVVVAVSDDNEREYIGQILTGFGVERTVAGSAEEVFELLHEAADDERPFNMCILDWKMPDLNAINATEKLRAEYDRTQLRIIVLAYDLAAASSRCVDAGADLAFGKPVFPSALYNTLTEVSSGNTHVVADIQHSCDFSGKRVLLVEDNKLNTEIARKLLEKVGIEVETAEDGRAGCDAFNASEPGYFDAILMDVQMPVMDGYRATMAIRAGAHPQAKTIPILAMTADAFTEDVQRAGDAGMNEHISKPVVPSSLYAVLKKYLYEA